jgi:hypothetical protein
VYVDEDYSGVPNIGEPRLASWTVSLMVNGATVKTAVTDANGQFSFTSLPVGDYTVCVAAQPGYEQNTPPGSASCPSGSGYFAQVTKWDPVVVFEIVFGYIGTV